jgi:hypothetical protein
VSFPGKKNQSLKCQLSGKRNRSQQRVLEGLEISGFAVSPIRSLRTPPHSRVRSLLAPETANSAKHAKNGVEPFFPSPHPTQPLFAALATAHLYSTFVLQQINELGAAIFSCPSAHFSLTAVIARRHMDFGRV